LAVFIVCVLFVVKAPTLEHEGGFDIIQSLDD